jgi:hypothetical protein
MHGRRSERLSGVSKILIYLVRSNIRGRWNKVERIPNGSLHMYLSYSYTNGRDISNMWDSRQVSCLEEMENVGYRLDP